MAALLAQVQILILGSTGADWGAAVEPGRGGWRLAVPMGNSQTGAIRELGQHPKVAKNELPGRRALQDSWGDRKQVLLWGPQHQKAAFIQRHILGLPDSANKNTRCSVKLELHINNEISSSVYYAPNIPWDILILKSYLPFI